MTPPRLQLCNGRFCFRSTKILVQQNLLESYLQVGTEVRLKFIVLLCMIYIFPVLDEDRHANIGTSSAKVAHDCI